MNSGARGASAGAARQDSDVEREKKNKQIKTTKE